MHIKMEKEIQIDLIRCSKAVLQKWWIILISAVIVSGSTFIIAKDIQDIYTAQTTVYSATYGSMIDSLAGLDVMQTYVEIIVSRKVADRAALLLGESEYTGDMIQGMVSTSYTEESAVLYIYANSTDSELSINIANAVAESFVIEAQNITGDNNIQILDQAKTANADGLSKQLLYSLIAFLIGAFCPISFIVIREIFF